jgi:hypothetical protein
MYSSEDLDIFGKGNRDAGGEAVVHLETSKGAKCGRVKPSAATA